MKDNHVWNLFCVLEICQQEWNYFLQEMSLSWRLLKGDYLFGLKQELDSYNFFQSKIKACDKEIEKLTSQQNKKSPEKAKLKTTEKPYKRVNKNAPEIKNFNQVAFQYFGGVDLMARGCESCDSHDNNE